ncbi:hypothetical protein bcCo53_001137 (plasmid) [Borrelia coriaceae]|uniref:Antigen P35 n=1 Tax=Borrelia coriaceae ATCC 43381 TaxID=1408429 RepID=W5SVB6_9SPIR|nr:hypothetical protein [Borrelia coriaceae]AHH11159.1 hypothetical protein BCO_0026900 [Borrelia coriaceae ATCC 43381]UPA16969.1 hypothetical protein bcCo53_001137 [Borrelia coriaceae]
MKKFSISFCILTLIVSCGLDKKLVGKLSENRDHIIPDGLITPKLNGGKEIFENPSLLEGRTDLPVDRVNIDSINQSDKDNINSVCAPYEILVAEVRQFSDSLKNLRVNFEQSGHSFKIPFNEFLGYLVDPNTHYDVYESLEYDANRIKHLENILDSLGLIIEEGKVFNWDYDKFNYKIVMGDVLRVLSKVAIVSRGDGQMYLSNDVLGKLKELSTEDEIKNITLQLRTLINARASILLNIKKHIEDAASTNDIPTILLHLQNIYHESKGINPLLKQFDQALDRLKNLIKRIISN